MCVHMCVCACLGEGRVGVYVAADMNDHYVNMITGVERKLVKEALSLEHAESVATAHSSSRWTALFVFLSYRIHCALCILSNLMDL